MAPGDTPLLAEVQKGKVGGHCSVMSSRSWPFKWAPTGSPHLPLLPRLLLEAVLLFLSQAGQLKAKGQAGGIPKQSEDKACMLPSAQLF